MDFFQKNETNMFSFFDKQKMCSFNRIIFPVHYNGNHWTLLEVNFVTKQVIHYDGCPGMRYKFYSQVAVNLLETYFTLANHSRKSLALSRWSTSNSTSYPTQIGGTDCGVFLLQGAFCMAFNNNKFNWSMADIHYLRKFYGGLIQHLANNGVIDYKSVLAHSVDLSEPEPKLKEQSKIEQIAMLKPHVVSPTKNKMQTVYSSLHYPNLESSLAKCNVIDLIAWSILTRIKFCQVDNKHHVDYKKHMEWLIDNVDDWPMNILETIPQLKQAYLRVLLQWDFNEATGNTRTDLGMMLLCVTLKCCSRKPPCMMSMMFNMEYDQKLWKKHSKKQRNEWIKTKAYRTEAAENAGVYDFSNYRTYCCRSWQAMYGVSSNRLNTIQQNSVAKKERSLAWKDAVHTISDQQLTEFNLHLLTTLLPNPFAPRGLNQYEYVCPPHISSYHQLYLDYVWHHIRKCKE